MSAHHSAARRAARLPRAALYQALLLGLAATAQAAPPAAEPTPIRCDGTQCNAEGELLFSLRSRSYDEPVTEGTSARSGSQALQPDRRVSLAIDEPGKATVRGEFMIRLPEGGAIWATEDPAMGQPELSVSAPGMVAFDEGRIVRPVEFYVRGNYTAFIQRLEVSVYRGSDTDRVAALATFELPVAAVSQGYWDGTMPASTPLRRGDRLVYVLRAFDADGNVDETTAQSMQLVTPAEFERGNQQLRDALEDRRGTSVDASQAASLSLLQQVFDGNGLRQQNIPVYGSRVRLRGRDLPLGAALKINGDSYPLDQDRKFAAEYLMPIGHHAFDVRVERPDAPAIARTLEVDVSGQYLFGVGLADITVYQNKASGAGQDLARGERNDDVLSDGRLAFYLKAKTRGRYLLTAQADTQNRPLDELFTGFTTADPRDLFRSLDPDLYYPTYGDDSLTQRDVDSMGRFYLRMDWDKNQALWGNYNTGLTGTEYAQYVRSLYGAALSWRSRGANAWGDARSELRLFGSQAETAPGHSEFIGTGGSLYYLRHASILSGSDQVVLEIRDRTTGRVEQRVPMVRGADYEIDALQGRILLTRPLAQVSRENLRRISRDVPLDGYEQRLIVDYEWVPTGFDSDDITAGVRGKHWFGDHVALGATYVDEQRAGQDYSLKGADLTLQAGRGTYLKVEHSRSEATSAPVFFSDNGGLSFTQLNALSGPRKGDARALEARANFKELGWTDLDWSVGAWWRDVDAGFSIGRFDTGADIQERGVEVLGQFAPNVNVHARYSRAERGTEALTQANVTGEWRITDHNSLAAEVRRVEERRLAGTAVGALGALQYKHRFGSTLDVYGTAQLTLDDDGGKYAKNNALTVGGKYLFGDLSSIGAEVTSGNRGDAAQINGEYRISPEHTFYGGYTYSTDKTDYDPLFNDRLTSGWTLGQRWRLSNQVNVFNESHFLKAPNESGLAHTFGMDFYPGVGWMLGFTLQQANLDKTVGNVDRRAVSVSAGRQSNDTQWQSKLEWRDDSGAEDRTQWLTTNNFSHKFNDSWRIAARFNYSKTTDNLQSNAGAKFIEGNVGFAYRPFDSGRWALFGKYTYLYDVSALPQTGPNVATYDQRSQVVSLEGIYHPNVHWEFAGKLMRREGEVRFGRLSGQWADSGATFAAGQVRYAFADKWHALGEYRWLKVNDGGTRQGALLGIDRDLGKNLRLGAGYNFTKFSDDLTNFDYDHKGWFVNFTGWY